MRRILVAFIALSVLGVAGTGSAGEGGSKKLFNGKDLSGWKYGNIGSKKGVEVGDKTETADKRIEVKDGSIFVNAKDAKGGGGIKDLFTVEEFGSDFVLKLQFKAGEKADSGVYIRGGGAAQLQIRDFPRLNQQKQLKKFKNDDWNDLEITVKGTEATFTVNGEALNPPKMKVPASGPIGVQAETGTFAFRNIEIKTTK